VYAYFHNHRSLNVSIYKESTEEMYEDSAEKSFYFGDKSQENDECELTKQANHSILA
jgi:hypothetical protein